MLTLLLLACGPKDVPASAPPPAAVEAPSRRALTLHPEDLRWDEAAGLVTASPGAEVKSASYERYVFDLAELTAALGGRPEAPVEVEVELLSAQQEVVTPEDPMSPAPQGGFHITTWTARVVPAAPPR